MRVIALVLAVSAVALARPQFQLSDKGYEGLQVALDGRTPVAISSGRLLYTAVDTGNNLVVVNVDGTGPVVGGGGSGIGQNLIRTDPNLGGGINDFGQGVLQFGQGVLDFTGDVVGGIGDVAEGTLRGFADLTGIADIRAPGDSSFRSLTEGVAAAPAAPADLGAVISDVGQGALLFGQGVIDAVGEITVGLGQAAEETLRSLSEGAQATSRQAGPAVIIVDEAAPGSASELGQGINDFGQGTLQFGLGVRDAVSDGVGVVGQVAEDILQGFADLTGIADIGAPTNTLAAEEAPTFRAAIEVAPVVVAPVVVAPAAETPFASGRTVIFVAEPELVMTITEAPRIPVAPIPVAPATSSLVVSAGVPLSAVAEPVVVEAPKLIVVEAPALVEVEVPAPVVVEEPVIVIVEVPAPVVVEEPVIVVVEAPAPVVVEAPAPIVVEEPALLSAGVPLSAVAEPVVVEAPKLIVVEAPARVEVEVPAPVVVEEPVIVVVEAPAPVVVEEPIIVVVDAPAPVVVEAPAPVVVEEPVFSGRTILVVAEPEPVIAVTDVGVPLSAVAEPVPVAVEAPSPVVVEAPAPVAVEVPKLLVFEAPTPVAVEEPAPSVVEVPAPVVVEAPAPIAVEAPVVIVVEDTAAVAPAAPEEAIVAPPQPLADVAVAPIVTEVGVPLAILTETIDETLNEIVPSAPQDDQNTSLAAAVARSGLVAVEDTAVVAPVEAILAPAPAEAVGVSLSAVIRRKRQIIEEPISNARAIGTGLGSLGGLFV